MWPKRSCGMVAVSRDAFDGQSKVMRDALLRFVEAI